MEITWYGHACFELKGNGTKIITDPFDESLGLPVPQLKADIVTVSHDSPRHNATHILSGKYKCLDGPGEYEINNIFITCHALYPPKADFKNVKHDRNIVCIYEIDGLTICHLGDIRHVPGQSQVEAFDNVDILLIPVGGGRSLNAANASEVIGIIEPAIVIPMHYYLSGMKISLEPLEKFLQEMGLTHLEPQSKLKITSSNLPTETQTIVLDIDETQKSSNEG